MAHRPEPPLGVAFRYGLLAALLLLLGFGLYGLYLTSKLPDPVLLTLNDHPPKVTVLANDGTVLAVRGSEHGEVRLSDLPRYLPEAVIATEDRRFYSNFGIDPVGMARAAFTDLLHGSIVEGGSTITQQLAKNLFLSPRRTLSRKLKEVIYAIWLDKRFTKNQILDLYLNRVYFGGGAYGVDAASEQYFGRPARDVTLTQAALLAGLLKAPSTYSPNHSVALARARLKVVLQNMVDAGYIGQAEADRAGRASLNLKNQGARSGYLYAVDWVTDRLPRFIGEKHGNLIIDTTIDPKLQRVAQRSLREHLDKQGKALNASQGAVVVLSPSGAIKALVGGKSYRESTYNRAVNAMRQPGSAFKPFVYLTALECGYTPDTIMEDSPVDINGWRPKDYERHYLGKVTLRQALADSLNTVAVKLVARVGASRVVRTAHRLGITTALSPEPSIALGTEEVNLLELTAAYAPFANGGVKAHVHVIRAIRNADGHVLYRWHPKPKDQVVPQADLGPMNDMMNATVVSGTGKRAGIPSYVAGGKTGTTQNSRDAWFVGYTSYYVAGVWIGNDDDKPMKRVTGGTLPAEIWHDVMLVAHRGKKPYALPGTYTPGLVEANGYSAGQDAGGTHWLEHMLNMLKSGGNG